MGVFYRSVAPWRLGISLGIDPICEMKVCSFDFIYCQTGRTTNSVNERDDCVNPRRIKKELAEYPYVSQVVNVATFSGSGEPTLNR